MIRTKQKLRDYSKLLVLLLPLCLFSCKSRTSKSFVNRLFTIHMGGDYHFKQVDSSKLYEGFIIVSPNDTIYYQLGFNISNLSEPYPNVLYLNIDSSQVKNAISDSSTIITTRWDFDPDNFKKQNISFSRQKGYPLKYTFPIDSSKGGMIGVYYDSLKVVNGGVLKFNMFCKYISPGNYKMIGEIIKGVVITPFDSTKLNAPIGTLYVQ